MLSDKEQKKEFKKVAQKEPDKYYATDYLKKEGFLRKKCKCGQWFWTTDPEQNVCGDAACSGGFRFLEKTPAKEPLTYIDVWKKFSKMFKGFGYTPIKRYPVVARWNPTMDYTIASIASFQPYVVSGEVKPPANPLVIPQFCLRFSDIDNVGITGSHMTGFVMIGQHQFVDPKEWNQEKVFGDIHNWLKKGLGLPNKEITFHEDAWAGGGNFGPCMEFFSRGIELGNQVYMMYEQTPKGPKELNLKILDMGMGQERNAWFSQGSNTIYDAVFPTVCNKLYKTTGVKPNELIKKYLPYAGYLNLDEVDDIDKAWKKVANKVGTNVKELKELILPLSGIYSIGEHTRALLVALSDGALPSNVGGGYNLRLLIRRALSFIDQYDWNIDLPEVCEWHASYLKPLFPELKENLEQVRKILDVEKQKYNNTKEKSRNIVQKIIQKNVNENDLLRLYDSQGIPPEIIKQQARLFGKEIDIPEDFYKKVSELHEKQKQEHATFKEEELPLNNVPDTEPLYFDNYLNLKNKGKVLKIIENNVILDKTVFYPTSGGQLHDLGTINKQKVIDVFKQGAIIVHKLEEKPKFKKGDKVEIEVEEKRRRQLTQHHSATHIVNAAAKRILGNHINQAGAKKTEEKAHLDITHYSSVSEDELKKIEKETNKLIKENIPIRSYFLPRDEAEKKFGMGIYQGGAVPGKKLRIIDIPEVDVEACGGTHLKSTKEIGEIKILKSTKIQDGVVRLTFTAGRAAQKEKAGEKDILKEVAKLLDCNENQIPGRTKELFKLWKTVVKKKKNVESKKLSSTEKHVGDILTETARILKTQPEHINKTIKRFLDELG